MITMPIIIYSHVTTPRDSGPFTHGAAKPKRIHSLWVEENKENIVR
jgi:hypothetical protein